MENQKIVEYKISFMGFEESVINMASDIFHIQEQIKLLD